MEFYFGNAFYGLWKSSYQICTKTQQKHLTRSTCIAHGAVGVCKTSSMKIIFINQP